MVVLRGEILKALEDFPNGAYVDEIWAWFDNVPAKDYLKKILVQLVNAGRVRAEKPRPAYGSEMPRAGMNRRKRYYLIRDE